MSQGEGGGAPLKYTPEWIENEADEFEAWMKKKESVFFKQFAIEQGYSPQRLTEFAAKSPKFAEVFARAKEWQEAKISTLSLWKKLDPSMSKWVLSVHHKLHAPEDFKETKPSDDLVNEPR